MIRNSKNKNNINLGICRFAIFIAITFFIAWLFNIEASKEYGWFAGIWHGLWAPYNWIRSIFYSETYCKAPLHTIAYNIWWSIFLVVSILSIVESLFNIINLRHK